MNGETNGENAHQDRDVNQAHGQQQQQQPYQAHHPAPVPQQNDYNGKLQESTQLGESSIYGGQSQLLQSQRTQAQRDQQQMQESEPSQSHYEIPTQQPRQEQFQNVQPTNDQLRNRGYADYEQEKKQKQYQDQPVHEPKPKGYSSEHKEFLNKKASNYNLVCSLEHDKKFLLTRKRELTAQKKLFFVSCICFLFMITEAVCGYLSGSIAVLADAAHMFSDVAGFMISFFSIYISQKKMTLDHNNGYHRAEVLGAILSVFFIWGLLIWLNWSATNRIIYGQEDINAGLMLITACFGLACNVLNLLALNFFCNPDESDDDEYPDEEISDIESEKPAKQGALKSQSSKSSRTMAEQMKGIYKPRHSRSFQRKEQKNAGTMTNILPETRQQLIDEHEANVAKKGEKVNLNQRAATIHLLGDMVQSIGVIAAACIIYFKGKEYQIADPICTYLFSVLVLMTTVPIFNECVKMIMEAGPDEINTLELYNELLAIQTVQEIHDFHCWQLAGGKFVATLHVRSRYYEKVISDINKVCSKDDYQIYHVTVQVEPEVAIGSHISCSHQCTVDKA